MGDQTLITTVVTPAESYNLVALADFKNALGISETKDDVYINTLIAATSAAVAQYCNRVFVPETVLDQFWAQRDHLPHLIRGGFSPLQLSRWPIISIDSVIVGTVTPVTLVSTVDPNTGQPDYISNANAGQLTRLNEQGNPRVWENHGIAVQYEAGYATTPPDLADAILRMMRMCWFARTRDPMLREENVEGAWSATYWFAAGPGSEGQFTPDIRSVLESYRVPVAH